MLPVALDRHDVYSLRLVCVHIDRETEVRRKVSAHLLPGFAGIIAAHYIPMLLHIEHVGSRWMHSNVVNARRALGGWVGNMCGLEPAVDGLPGLAAVVCAEGARRRDGDDDPARLGGIKKNRMQAHATTARLPVRA